MEPRAWNQCRLQSSCCYRLSTSAVSSFSCVHCGRAITMLIAMMMGRMGNRIHQASSGCVSAGGRCQSISAASRINPSTSMIRYGIMAMPGIRTLRYFSLNSGVRNTELLVYFWQVIPLSEQCKKWPTFNKYKMPLPLVDMPAVR